MNNSLPGKPVIIHMYKTNVGNFIKFATAYPYASFAGKIVNGLSHETATIVNGWAKIGGDVYSVQEIKRGKSTVIHWKIKDTDLISAKLPEIVKESYWDDDIEEQKLKGVEGYESLYSPVYETEEDTLVDVPYEVVILGEFIINNPFNLKERKIKYKQDGSFGNGKVVEQQLSQVVVYDDIVKLLTPEFAIEEAPCKLNSKQMYMITRQYILENLDMKENVITSNYDFCFTVKKRVHTKPFTTTESYLASRNKWKTKSVTKNEKLIEVFEMTYSGYKGARGYDGYTCIPELHGNSVEDLYNKLDKFLTALINDLNSVVTECDCCKGTGYTVKSAANNLKSILGD